MVLRNCGAIILVMAAKASCFFSLATFVFCASFGLAIKYQKFLVEPQDRTVFEGTRVVLPCKIINKSGAVQWTKDDIGLGSRRKLAGHDAYRMIGNTKAGNYSLRIRYAVLDDEGTYRCTVSPGREGQPGIISRPAILTVITPSKPPIIVGSNPYPVEEGVEATMTCVSTPEKKPPRLTWMDNYGKEIKENVSYSIEPYYTGHRLMAIAILKIVPEKRQHDAVFKCQSQTEDTKPRSRKLKLEVMFRPEVNLTILSGGAPAGYIKEGGNVTFQCRAEGRPAAMSYKWVLNGKIVGWNSTEYSLQNVTRELDGAVIKCEVRNSVGKSMAFETLLVSNGSDINDQDLAHSTPQAVESEMTTQNPLQSTSFPSGAGTTDDDSKKSKAHPNEASVGSIHRFSLESFMVTMVFSVRVGVLQ